LRIYARASTGRKREAAIRSSIAHSLARWIARRSLKAQPRFGRAFTGRRQRRALTAYAGIVVLGLAALFFNAAKTAHEQAEAAAGHEAELQVRLVEEHAARSLDVASALIAKVLADRAQAPPGFDSLARRIDDYRGLIADFRSLAFYTLDGDPAAESGLAPLEPAMRARIAAADVGEIAILRDAEAGVLAVAHRLSTGSAVLRVGTGYLQRDFANAVPQPIAVLLQDPDGATLAAYPPQYADARAAALVGPPPADWFRALLAPATHGALAARRTLENHRLQAVALFDRENYLGPYRATAATRAMRAAAVAAALLGIAWMVAAQFARLARLDALRVRQRAKAGEQRRRMRAIIDAIPAIVNAKDVEGRYMLVNRFHARIFGVTPEQAVGKRLDDFVEAGFAAEVRAREQARLVAGVGAATEDTFVIDGQPRSFLANKVPLVGPTGALEGLVTVAIDVTDFKAVERKATAAELLLRTALDSIPEGFAVFGEDDRLVIANRTYTQMFTKFDDPAKIEGLTFADLVRLSMRAGEPPEPGFAGEAWVAERVRRHLAATGLPRLLQVGDGRWVSTLERRVPGIGIVGFRADVTHAMQTQADLRQARDAAEAASRAKSQFLANMSHELRTPLNAIIGFSEVIESQMFGPVGNPRYAEYARDIAASGRHLVALIGDVLDMSKIEAGGYELEEAEFGAQEWLAGTLALMRGHAQARGVALGAQTGALAQVGLRADSRALRQILINLLSNAIKFSSPGSQVTVGARLSPAGLEISVADAGIGISQDELKHVAEPFRQAHGVSGRFGGTGLGLSISKRLIELHGGRLEIESALGVGTTARILLPDARVVRRDAA